MSHSTLKVYIAAIVAYQPSHLDAARLFSHPTLKKFFKGLRNIRPPHQPPLPQWPLQLVLNALTQPSFEPMATTNLKLLSLKTSFLVAITSAKCTSKLAALRSDQPFLQFHLDKVTLYPDVSFLPKVVSDFHLNQPVILLILFSSPSTPLECMLHTFDVRRYLAFYIDRTKLFRKASRLFLCFHGPNKGSLASSQTLARWIVQFHWHMNWQAKHHLNP